MKRILVIIFLVILFSCGQGAKSEKRDIDYKANSIVLKDKLSCELNNFLDSEPNHILLYYFDGGCSMCLGNFITWVKSAQELNVNKDFKILGVSTPVDEDILEYYLEQSNIININNLFIFVDSNSDFSLENNSLFPNESIYMLDGTLKVIDVIDANDDIKFFQKKDDLS